MVEVRSRRVLGGLSAGAVMASWSLAAFGQVTVRSAAEFEPAIGASVRFPFGVPSSVLVEIARDDLLFVYVSSSQQAAAQGNLSGAGVNMANVRWLIHATDSIWVRDWGPTALYDSNGGHSIGDHRFTGYSTSGFDCGSLFWFDQSGWLNDEVAPVALANFLGVPRVTVPAFLVGGNMLIDGTGRSFSTCLLLRENLARGISETAVRSAAATALGVTQMVILPNFESNGIQHIDCAIKLIDTETILVKRTPANHPSFSATNQLASILSSMAAPSGRPYTVHRIDTPYFSGTSITNYTNALILNRKVLMPAWNIPGDAAAAATFSTHMPGYTVVQHPWTSWQSNDALHCRVRAVWDPGMLHIGHTRLGGTVPLSLTGFGVEATIRPYSGAGVAPGSAVVRWRVAGPGAAGPWNESALLAGAGSFSYTGTIPFQPVGTVVEYSVHAADLSGRSESLPRTAPAWTYRFTVGAGACYANCDGSTGLPVLSPSDFACFLAKFRAGDTYANCDGSTLSPALTPSDFVCFLNQYRAGCS